MKTLEKVVSQVEMKLVERKTELHNVLMHGNCVEIVKSASEYGVFLKKTSKQLSKLAVCLYRNGCRDNHLFDRIGNMLNSIYLERGIIAKTI